MSELSLHSPVGELTLFAADGAIVALEWGRGMGGGMGGGANPLLVEARRQLLDYFDGRRTAFDLPLSAAGTPARKRLWQRLTAIPYGQTTSYGALAKASETSARAVGGACAANPIPILIPCHRVTAANGALTGYSGDGGIGTKRALLRLEGALPANLI